jgi:hypothetical protein
VSADAPSSSKAKGGAAGWNRAVYGMLAARVAQGKIYNWATCSHSSLLPGQVCAPYLIGERHVPLVAGALIQQLVDPIGGSF